MKKLIKSIAAKFQQKTRNDGTNYTVFNSKDDIEQTFIQNCHGTVMLPNDFRFNILASIFDHLSDYGIESFDEMRDNGIDIEIINNMIDIYNHNLLKWVSSNLLRAEYVNKAVNENLTNVQDFNLFNALQVGQYLEIEELFNNVINELEKMV